MGQDGPFLEPSVQISAMFALVELTGRILHDAKKVVTPAVVESVRKLLPADQRHLAPVLLDLATGTANAAARGKGLPGWIFTARAAEQGTLPVLAAYHAATLGPASKIVEACTGAGLDTQAFAQSGASVVTFEHDELTATVASHNLRPYAHVTVITEALPSARWHEHVLTADAVWADPSRRRPDGGRARRGTQYEPPLELFATLPDHVRVGIKTGPGDDLQPPAGFVSEWIGFGAECKERVLWRGVDRAARSVTLISPDGASTSWTPTTDMLTPNRMDVQEGMILVEPHAALIASGVLGAFYAENGISVIDELIAYGVHRDRDASPWFDRFHVVRVDAGANPRRMQEHIRELGWNRETVIKKRGWDRDPEVVRSHLEFCESDVSGVIIVTRVGKGHVTVYAERCAVSGER
jgi:hypothetical protein